MRGGGNLSHPRIASRCNRVDQRERNTAVIRGETKKQSREAKTCSSSRVTKCRRCSNEERSGNGEASWNGEFSSNNRRRDRKKKNGHVPAKNIDGEHLKPLLRVQCHDRLHALVQDSIPCIFCRFRVARHLLIHERITNKKTQTRGTTDIKTAR